MSTESGYWQSKPHEFHLFADGPDFADACAECPHGKQHPIHGYDPLAEAVAEAEAELNREVWMAVRISTTGNVAFMGAFDTLEHAKQRCEYGTDRTFEWHSRSPHPQVEEYETPWFKWTEEASVKFVIAFRSIQDDGEPRSIRRPA